VYEALFRQFGQSGRTYIVRESPARLSDIMLSSVERDRLKVFRFAPPRATHQAKAFGSVLVRLLTDKEYVVLFADSKSCPSAWKSFHQQYPDAKVLIELSQVGVDRSGSEAVVLMHVGSACFGGTWDLLFFRRAGPIWEFKEAVNVGRS